MPPKHKQEVVITIDAPEQVVLNEPIIGQCLSLAAEATTTAQQTKLESLIASALGVADSYTVVSTDRDTVDFALEIITYAASCHSNYLLALASNNNSSSSSSSAALLLPPPPPFATTSMIMTPKKTLKFFNLMLELRDFIHKGDLESAKRHLKSFVTAEIVNFNRENAIQKAQEEQIRQQQSVLAGMGIVPSLDISGKNNNNSKSMNNHHDDNNMSHTTASGGAVSFHASPVPPLRQLGTMAQHHDQHSHQRNQDGAINAANSKQGGNNTNTNTATTGQPSSSKSKKNQQQDQNENQQPQIIIPANQLFFSTVDVGNIVDFAASGLFQNWRLYHGAYIHSIGLTKETEEETNNSSVATTTTIIAPIVPVALPPPLRYAKPLEQWEADEATKKKMVADELIRLQEKERLDLELEATERAEQEAAEERARQEEEAAKLFFERHGTDLAVQHVQKELQNDIQQKHASLMARIAKLEEMYRIQL